jgi:hypothetical protein
MIGNIASFDRRLARLENSKLGTPAYSGVVRLIVQEHEDADRIIDRKRQSGEIKPDTLVIVRQIVSPPSRSSL